MIDKPKKGFFSQRPKEIIVLTIVSGLFTFFLFILLLLCWIDFLQLESPLSMIEKINPNNIFLGQELGPLSLPLNGLIGFSSLLLGPLAFLLSTFSFLFSIILLPIFFILTLLGFFITRGIWKVKKWALLINLFPLSIYFILSLVSFLGMDIVDIYNSIIFSLNLIISTSLIVITWKGYRLAKKI